jgi:RNA polymerase-binding protein DksA
VARSARKSLAGPPAVEAAPDEEASVGETGKAPAKKAAPARRSTATKKASQAAKAPHNSHQKASPVKNAAVKKASAGALRVREGEEAWTKAELDEVLADLHLHRDRLVEIMEAQERELSGLMKDAGDGAGHDQADLGATSFERDHELTLMNSEREMLEQIEKALARIDDGTYGVCESCGEPIGKMRVMAFPRATLCLSCKQREERR